MVIWCVRFQHFCFHTTFSNWSFLTNPYHATGFFIYFLKAKKNLLFSDVFKKYRKKLVTWNGLKHLMHKFYDIMYKSVWTKTIYINLFEKKSKKSLNSKIKLEYKLQQNTSLPQSPRTNMFKKEILNYRVIEFKKGNCRPQESPQLKVLM